MADLVTFHPPAEFRLRSDIAGKTIDPAIKAVVTHGDTVLGKGGARYTRVTGTPPITNRGYISLGDGTYLVLDAEQQIRVTMFGALGDDSADDSVAMDDASAFCATIKGGTLYVPLNWPVGNYRRLSASSCPTYEGMRWNGEGMMNNEFEIGARIRNSASNMFAITVDRKKMQFSGLLFDGSNLTRYMFPPTGTTPIIWYTAFLFCGFKNFATIFKNVFSGCRIQDCYFQNSLCMMEIAGADTIVRDNFIAGSNWRSGSAEPVQSQAGASTFAILFSGWFRMSRFERNFITGWPQMIMKSVSRLDYSIFHANWFDISDWSALALEGSSGGTFSVNTFNRNMLGGTGKAGDESGSISATYNAIVRVHNTVDTNFSANVFGYADNGVPSPSPLTWKFTGTSARNYLNGNLYQSPYRRSISLDATAEPPRISETPGPDLLAMSTSTLTFRPMIAEQVYANTALTANWTLTLSKTGAEMNDLLDITRGPSATGAFNLNIINGAAGPTIKALASASTWARVRYDGSNWILVGSGAFL